MRHVCFLETFNLRYVFDVGVTRLLRTCQTRFQCFQTPCVSLLGHHRTVMCSCRSCPGQAVVKPLQLSGSSPARTPPYFSGPRTRKWKRKLQLTRRSQGLTPPWSLSSSWWWPRCWTSRPWQSPARRSRAQQTRQLSAFCQSLAAWLAIRRPGGVGRRMISWRLYKVVLWHRDRTDKPLDRKLPDSEARQRISRLLT